MKNTFKKFGLAIAIAILIIHVTVTPIVITHYLNQPKPTPDYYTTHYASGQEIETVQEIVEHLNQ